MDKSAPPEIRMVVHKDVHWHPVLQIFFAICALDNCSKSICPADFTAYSEKLYFNFGTPKSAIQMQ